MPKTEHGVRDSRFNRNKAKGRSHELPKDYETKRDPRWAGNTAADTAPTAPAPTAAPPQPPEEPKATKQEPKTPKPTKVSSK